MVKLSELLSNKGLSRIKFLTSSNGPDTLVKEITVMEVPEVSRWLKGNELVITSLYAVKDSVDSQVSLIKELKGVNCSGLLVKLGPYVEKLDNRVVKMAEELGIPILTIPKDMTYVDIIGLGIRIIHREEEDIFCIENVLKKILRKQNVEELEINELERLFEVSNLEELYFLIILSTTDQCWNKIAHQVITYKIRHSKYYVNAIISRDKEELINNKKVLENMILEIKNCQFLIGKTRKNLFEFKKEYELLCKTLDDYELIKSEKVIYHKKDIEEYINEYKFYKTKGKKYYHDYLVDLDIEDILTLSAYINNNLNIIETSEELFLHKNTIRYRLSNIEERTKLNLSNFQDLIKLHYALKYLEFIHNH